MKSRTVLATKARQRRYRKVVPKIRRGRGLGQTGRGSRTKWKDIAVNSLKALNDHGQVIWLDFLSRRFIEDGSLKKLVQEDGLTGVTSNPSIFKKAIADTSDYDAALNSVLADEDPDAMTIYEQLAIADIQAAAEVLLPVYRRTNGADGFVSLEVSPFLANDTDGTVAEARRLCQHVRRDNVMIKVPATEAGIPAIRQLIGDGVNINITLLFSRGFYAQVAEAYLAGAERYLARGGDPKKFASVASFFVSRIDTAVDKAIEEKMKNPPANVTAEQLAALRGTIAVANAKLAYQDYKKFFSGPRWQKLADAGIRVQRLLWASTGTKNPTYSDVLYVEELIGRDTVNTMPLDTIKAFRDHGRLRDSLEENIAQESARLDTLAKAGISLDAITEKLTADGVKQFADAFEDLLAAIEKKRTAKSGSGKVLHTASQ
jgi:transaldolase/glucose-6-phosphate isomerase